MLLPHPQHAAAEPNRHRRDPATSGRNKPWRRLTTLVLVLLAAVPRVQVASHVKIALWGDFRENRLGACENIADLLLHKITDWNFQIHTGDFTHDGSDAAWQQSFSYRGMDSLFLPGRFLMCTSNHDAVRNTYDSYTAGILPTNSADNTTHFYHFQRANVHVVACDGYFTPPQVMNHWLDSTLATIPEDDWLIGVWHNPCYGDVTYKDSYLSLCRTWLDKFAAHGGDFIFHGHAHTYVRTYPLLPDGSVSFERGMVHIVNGCGGADFKRPQHKGPKTAFTPDGWSFAMVTFVTFEGDVATVETVDARKLGNTGIVDRWSWKRAASAVGHGESPALPHVPELLLPSPNPFNQGTTFQYRLSESDQVRLQVFSTKGELVASLENGYQEAGLHVVRWTGQTIDGAPVPSGLYLVRLRAGRTVLTRKAVLVR